MTDPWKWHLITGINPEPYTIPGVGAIRKGGKVIPRFFKHEGLRVYQEAVKETLEDQKPEKLAGQIWLRFYFWRHLLPYETHQAKTARKHEADATNLQKALEDALQGVLFHNDRDVVRVTSEIMEQGHDTMPAILIGVAPALRYEQDVDALRVAGVPEGLISELKNPVPPTVPEAWNVEDVF